MGFLSAYSGTERVIVGARKDGEPYWVDVKKCLSREESEVAEKILSSSTTIRQQAGERTMTTGAYRTYLVTASIMDWNLDEDDGTVWALSPDSAKRRNVGRLPDPVFHEVFLMVDSLNAPLSTKQRSDFRDESGDRGPVGEGDVGAGESEDVRPGDEAVGAARGAVGDVHPAPLA